MVPPYGVGLGAIHYIDAGILPPVILRGSYAGNPKCCELTSTTTLAFPPSLPRCPLSLGAGTVNVDGFV